MTEGNSPRITSEGNSVSDKTEKDLQETEELNIEEEAVGLAARGEVRKPVEVVSAGAEKPKRETSGIAPSEGAAPRKEESPVEKEKRLEEELKAAREKYAKAHYDASSKIHWLKRALPFTKTEVGSLPDVNEAYGKYKEAMGSLMSSQLEALKGQTDLSSEAMKKEMGTLVKYYSLNEKTALFEARTDARAKAREGKITEALWKGAAKTINWYRKLKPRYKIALGVVLFAGGGLGVLGAGTITAATLTRRAFSSAALGAGTVAGLEAWHRRGAGKVSEKALEALGKESGENQFAKLQEILDGQIKGYDQALSKELKSARNRKLIGAGAGVLAFAIPLGLKHFFGAAEHVAGTSGEEKIAKAAELTVQKGSSIEGTLIRNFGSSLKDTSGNFISREQAEGIAHRMAVAYAKERGIPFEKLNLVEPGLKIEVIPDPTSPDGFKIANLEGKFGWKVPEHGLGSKEPAPAEPALTREDVAAELRERSSVQELTQSVGKNMSKDLTALEGYSDRIDELKVQLHDWETTHRDLLTERHMGVSEEEFKPYDQLKEKIRFNEWHRGLTLIGIAGNISKSIFEDSGFKTTDQLAKINANWYLTHTGTWGESARSAQLLRGLANQYDVKPNLGENLKHFTERVAAKIVRAET